MTIWENGMSRAGLGELGFLLLSDIEQSQFKQHAFEHAGFDLGQIALSLFL